MKKSGAFLLTAILLAFLAVLLWQTWQPLMDFLGAQGGLIQGADSLLSILAGLGALPVA